MVVVSGEDSDDPDSEGGMAEDDVGSRAPDDTDSEEGERAPAKGYAKASSSDEQVPSGTRTPARAPRHSRRGDSGLVWPRSWAMPRQARAGGGGGRRARRRWSGRQLRGWRSCGGGGGAARGRQLLREPPNDPPLHPRSHVPACQVPAHVPECLARRIKRFFGRPPVRPGLAVCCSFRN